MQTTAKKDEPSFFLFSVLSPIDYFQILLIFRKICISLLGHFQHKVTCCQIFYQNQSSST